MFIFLFINQSGVVLTLSDNLSFSANMALGRGYIYIYIYTFFLLACVFGRELVFPSYYYIKNI